MLKTKGSNKIKIVFMLCMFFDTDVVKESYTFQAPDLQ